jgi:precorrin-2 dehydrogenase/sirohydrochlorin ferrochelatase
MTDAADAVPLLVEIRGRRVVSIGGGAVAAGKLLPLATEYGADVTVIAPRIDDRLVAVVTWHERPYEGPGDLDGAALVVASTDDAHLNARIAGDAADAGILCVRTDSHEHATAAFPATLRQDGRSPTVARWLRSQLEETYGPEYGELVLLLGELRRDPRVHTALARLTPDERRLAWRSIPLVDILDLLRSGARNSAKEVAAACLFSYSG